MAKLSNINKVEEREINIRRRICIYYPSSYLSSQVRPNKIMIYRSYHTVHRRWIMSEMTSLSMGTHPGRLLSACWQKPKRIQIMRGRVRIGRLEINFKIQ